MKKIILYNLFFLFFIMLSPSFVSANDAEGSGHDIGFTVGPSFALTDLGGANKIGAPFLRDIDFKATRYSLSVFYRYNVNKWISVRANLMYGMLSASDRNTSGIPPSEPGGPSNSWYRSHRNLNFTTHMIEFQAIAEINLKKYMHDAASGSKDRWAPYIGGGLGFFWFDPYTKRFDVSTGKYVGEKIKLRKLGTEGQGLPGQKPIYKSVNFDLIALLGIKFNVTEKFSIAFEGWYHQTFTDNLDDVAGDYPNADVLALMSPLAQEFSDRTQEPGAPYPEAGYHYIVRDINGIGQERGDNNIDDVKGSNDQFLNFKLAFTFALGAGGKKMAFGSCGRRNPYHHKFSCPKW